MNCNFRKLKGRIVEKYNSVSEFAEAAKTSRQVVYNKLCGNTDFSRECILNWCKLLDIPNKEITDYFF